MLEAYRPYADYVQMRELTERLIKDAAWAVFGSVSLPLGRKASSERVVRDVSGPWRVVSVCDALSEALGRRVDVQTDFEELLALAQQHGVRVHEGMGPGPSLRGCTVSWLRLIRWSRRSIRISLRRRVRLRHRIVVFRVWRSVGIW